MKKARVIKTALLIALSLGINPIAFTGDYIHIANQDDTFWDLCIKHTNKRGCWLELPKYNNISNDRAIPIGYPIRIPGDWLVEPPVVGNVDSISGDVSYYRSQSAEMRSLQSGQQLHLGGRIVSAAGSAILRLGSDNVVLIRPFSELVLDTMSGASSTRNVSEINLSKGEVEVKVKPNRKTRFLINTPAAIAAVRGTEYRVSVSNEGSETTRGEVLAGAVEIVANQDAVLVPEGFGVAAQKGQALEEPRKLLAAPVFSKDYSSVNSSVNIEWSMDRSAAHWVLDVLASGESAALLNSYSTDAPSYMLQSLEEGCYQLRVRAVDVDGFNGLNSETAICVVPRLAAVTGVSEILMDESTNQLIMRWLPVEGAQQYRVEIANDESFKTIVNAHIANSPSVNLEGLATTAFYARVVAIDEAGNEAPESDSQKYQPEKPFPWGAYLAGMLVFFLAL